MNNYYEVLGVSKNISQLELKQAYKKLALEYHPDKYKGNIELAKKKFITINTAYKILSNENTRLCYDNGIEISDKELQECKNMSKKLFDTIFLKKDYGKIINNLSIEEKKILSNFISPFYDKEDDFYNDLKDGNTEKIMEIFNSKFKIYLKNLTIKKSIIIMFKYSWYTTLYFYYNIKSYFLSFF
jgi:DnaJ-class molecular chaperone